MSDAYNMIDRFLRNNLNSDEDYAEYSAALDSLVAPPGTVSTTIIKPAREWVGLTDEEANELWESTDSDWELMKRTEAKLREKNA